MTSVLRTYSIIFLIIDVSLEVTDLLVIVCEEFVESSSSHDELIGVILLKGNLSQPTFGTNRVDLGVSVDSCLFPGPEDQIPVWLS